MGANHHPIPVQRMGANYPIPLRMGVDHPIQLRMGID